jgi:hypothetical protein
MATMLNDGYCPECQLNGEDVRLQLNSDDFWECPKSHLQLAVYGINAVILQFRGIGKFKEGPIYGTHLISGAILKRAKGQSIFPVRNGFDSVYELKDYLLDVEPRLELSLQNLVDSFAKYKYGNPFTYENSPLPYKRQSKYFKIDFENQSILKKLEKRDKQEGVSFPWHYTHLYRLLMSLFEKYYDGDASWLPEMGMSQIEVELCKKHLHRLTPEVHGSESKTVKQRILALIVNLVEIIYRGKDLELINNNDTSGNPHFKIPQQDSIPTLQEDVDLNRKQKEFLRLHVICGENYQNISKKLNIPRATLTQWYEVLRPERERIAKVRKVWTIKKFTPLFEDFYNWHNALERKCHYCDITEAEISELLNSSRLATKRISTRGRKLEFDRKEPNLSYDNLDNIVLCCYWCNNAKTETFTHSEFIEVGKAIRNIWKQRMAK